jgi:T4 RnlA family RNA ligase
LFTSEKMWKTHVDLNVLKEYQLKHLLRSQHHPALPLIIYNYTSLCQYKPELWDNVTTLCRGLIVHSGDGRIVGRSFPKFWNETDSMHEATEGYDIFEKLDGSLGILFNFEGKWIISSRGSFESPQAVKASAMLFQQGRYILDGLDKELSYVFEIIYPENRIVVDYKDREELVLLAIFRMNGQELYPISGNTKNQVTDAGFTIARCFNTPLRTVSVDKMKDLNWENSEGFVVRFDNGQRSKIKFDGYLTRHRARDNITVASIFSLYRDRKALSEVIEIYPNEFHDWAARQWEQFQERYSEKLAMLSAFIEDLYNSNTHMTQKDFAEAVKLHPHKAALFTIRKGDQKAVFEVICKLIESEFTDCSAQSS